MVTKVIKDPQVLLDLRDLLVLLEAVKAKGRVELAHQVHLDRKGRQAFLDLQVNLELQAYLGLLLKEIAGIKGRKEIVEKQETKGTKAIPVLWVRKEHRETVEKRVSRVYLLIPDELPH